MSEREPTLLHAQGRIATPDVRLPHVAASPAAVEGAASALRALSPVA